MRWDAKVTKMLELNKIYNMDAIEFLEQVDDCSIDLIITDPPYNTGFTASPNSAWLNSFFNDNKTKNQYEWFMKKISQHFTRVLKPNRPCFVFIDYRNLANVTNYMTWGGLSFMQTLIWDKVIHGLNFQHYAYQYENILFFIKGENYFPKRLRIKTDILRYQRVNPSFLPEHETVKPIELIRDLIFDNSYEDDIVLDCFMGTGTTALASYQLNRKFIGSDTDKRYCDIANLRLNQTNLNKYLGGDLNAKQVV